MVISFHELDLLLPLLRDLPGANWTVEHTTMERQVERLTGKTTTKSPLTVENDGSASKHFSTDNRKPLNVLVCRRGAGDNAPGGGLDFDAVCDHIHRVNDQWFQEQQPLLTEDRIRDLKFAFEDNGIDGEGGERITDGRTLSIDEAFLVLFTEAEREHLTFDHFLQDLEAFQATRKAMNSTQDSKVMSFETALEFLKEMQ